MDQIYSENMFLAPIMETLLVCAGWPPSTLLQVRGGLQTAVTLQRLFQPWPRGVRETVVLGATTSAHYALANISSGGEIFIFLPVA